MVFTAATSSAIIDPAFNGAFAITPNPVRQAALQVNFSLSAGGAYMLTITDLTGKVLTRQPLAEGDNQSLLLDKIPVAGLYFVHLWHNDRPVAVEKLVVLN